MFWKERKVFVKANDDTKDGTEDSTRENKFYKDLIATCNGQIPS